jgi:hypothetical protein
MEMGTETGPTATAVSVVEMARNGRFSQIEHLRRPARRAAPAHRDAVARATYTGAPRHGPQIVHLWSSTKPPAAVGVGGTSDRKRSLAVL